jgi:hypothetical protein
LFSFFSRRTSNPIWSNLLGARQELDELLDDSSRERFVNILKLKRVQVTHNEAVGNASEDSSSVAANVSALPGVSAQSTHTVSTQSKANDEARYSDLLLRIVEVKPLILKLKKVLEKIGVRHLYIFVDDFSELPEEAM